MGLREKVALIFVVVLIIQMTKSNRLPSASRQDAVDRYLEARGIQTSKAPSASTSNIKINIHPSLKKSMLRSFNFPETEYPTASTRRDYYNTGSKLKTNFGSLAKDDSQIKAVEELKKDMRMKRKLDRIHDHYQTPGTSNAIPKPVPELITNKGFPEVQYPLNVLDTWEPNYWNTPTIDQNELQYEQPDFPMFSQRVSDKTNKSGPTKKQSKSIVKQFMEDIDTLNEKMHKSKTNVKETRDFNVFNKTDSKLQDSESLLNSTSYLNINEGFINNSAVADNDLHKEKTIAFSTNQSSTSKENTQLNPIIPDEPIPFNKIPEENNNHTTVLNTTASYDLQTIASNESLETESLVKDNNDIKIMSTDDPLDVIIPQSEIKDEKTSHREALLSNTNMNPHATFIVVPVEDYENMMEMPIFHRNTSSSIIVFMPSKTKNVTYIEAGATDANDTSLSQDEVNSHVDEDNRITITSNTKCSLIHQNNSLCYTQPNDINSNNSTNFYYNDTKFTFDILPTDNYPLNGTSNDTGDTKGDIIKELLLSNEIEIDTPQPTSIEILNKIHNDSSLMDNFPQMKSLQDNFIRKTTDLKVIDSPFTHMSSSDPLVPEIYPFTQLDTIIPENYQNINIIGGQPDTEELSDTLDKYVNNKSDEVEYIKPVLTQDKLNPTSLQIPRQVDIDDEFGIGDNDTHTNLPLFKEATISGNTTFNINRHDQLTLTNKLLSNNETSEAVEDNRNLESLIASHDKPYLLDHIPLTADEAALTDDYFGSIKPSDDIKNSTSSMFKSPQQNHDWSATLDIPVSNYKRFRDTLKDAVHFSIINKMPPLDEPEHNDKLPSYSVLLHYDRNHPPITDSQPLISDKNNSNDNIPSLFSDSNLRQDIDGQLVPNGESIHSATAGYTNNVQNDPKTIVNQNVPVSKLSLEDSPVLNISNNEEDVDDDKRFLFTTVQNNKLDMISELNSTVKDVTLNNMTEPTVPDENAISPLDSNDETMRQIEPIDENLSDELIDSPFVTDESKPITESDKRLSARNTFTETPGSETYTEKVLPVTVIVNSIPEDKIREETAETLVTDDSINTENFSEMYDEYSDEILVNKPLYADHALADADDDEQPLKINILPEFWQKSNGNKINHGKKNRLLSVDKDISRITPSHLINYLYTTS